MTGADVLPPQTTNGRRVADQMEAFFEKVGGDGFMLTPIHSPGTIDQFVDLMVPEFQRRGLYRTEYKGKTQREILRQED